MKKSLYLACVYCAVFLSSCHTALYVTPEQSKTPYMEQANMEFIGCKNMSALNPMFKDFGTALERCNIAINRQGYYGGDYSMYELERYKSSSRYITFIDVSYHSYSHNDAVHDNYSMELAGWLIGSFTAFTLMPVYIPLLCCSDKNDCQLILKGKYNIVVYDTKQKDIVFNSPIEINEDDIYKGQYSHKKTNQKAVNERYKNILYNALLDHYAQAYNYVNTLPK